MEDSRVGSDINRGDNELTLFHELGKALTSTLDIKEVLRIIMQKIGELLQPRSWSLLLVDEKKSDLYYEIVVGRDARDVQPIRLSLGERLPGWVAREGKAILIPDIRKERKFLDGLSFDGGPRSKSVICVPLVSKGKTLGVIEMVDKLVGGPFSPGDLSVLTTFADYAAIAIENARNFQKVQELTITDDVTSLYNSRHMHNLLDFEIVRSKRYNLEFSIIFFDLDYFKRVNDTYGHLMGSKTLRAVAEIVSAEIRKLDVATRYGGDEFVILLPQTPKHKAV
ncbi:MAG: diguanylate cyclase, partial [Vicinamibacteria bacterium]